MTSILDTINSLLIKCEDYEIRAHFQESITSFFKIKNCVTFERKKKTNDTVSCPNMVEAAVEKLSSSNFANVHDF